MHQLGAREKKTLSEGAGRFKRNAEKGKKMRLGKKSAPVNPNETTEGVSEERSKSRIAEGESAGGESPAQRGQKKHQFSASSKSREVRRKISLRRGDVDGRRRAGRRNLR